MLFYEKLNAVLQCLNCSGSVLSKRSGLDPSLISRFRTGERLPKQGSPRLLSLCQALGELAAEQNAERQIFALCGSNSLKLPLSDCLFRWFHSSEMGRKSEDGPSKKNRLPLTGFGPRLDTLMTVLSVSNIRLAKQLNVDASLISRLRSGKRILRTDSLLLDGVSRYFAFRTEPERRKTLIKTIGLSEKEQDLTEESLKAAVFQWLSVTDTGSFLPFLTDFLDAVGETGGVCYKKEPPLLNRAISEAQSDSLFFGKRGFCLSLIRLLLEAEKKAVPQKVYLYLDGNLDEFFKDNDLLSPLFFLMYRLSESGFHFQVICTVQNKLSVLFPLLTHLLPLLLAGNTELFSAKKTEPVFSHMFAVIKRCCSVSSFYSSGGEGSACFQFSEDCRLAENFDAQFSDLLSCASPLAKGEKSKGDFIFYQKEREEHCHNLKSLCGSPSFYTLPRALLERILLRIDFEKREEILVYYDSLRSRFLSFIKDRDFEEYFPLPVPNDVKKGTVPVPLPDRFAKTPVYYTPEELTEHLSELLILMWKKSGYSFYPVLESPSGCQLVVRTEPPEVVVRASAEQALTLQSPLLYFAFLLYCDSLPRLAVREVLSDFLDRYFSAILI